jgi:Protein of unknown function (DUF1761)
MDINYIGVVAGAVSVWMLGMVWYTVLFGRAWQAVLGVQEASYSALGMLRTMAIHLVFLLIQAYVVGYAQLFLGVADWYAAVELGVWIWVGFMLPIFVNTIIYEQRSMKYFWISSMYMLVGSVLMSVVLLAIGPVHMSTENDAILDHSMESVEGGESVE